MDWNLLIWVIVIFAGAWLLGGLVARIIVGSIIARKAEKLFNHTENKFPPKGKW